MISLRTVGSIEATAFYGNKLSTVTLPAGYDHHALHNSELSRNYLMVSDDSCRCCCSHPSIRLSNLGNGAFQSNQLTSVTFLG